MNAIWNFVCVCMCIVCMGYSSIRTLRNYQITNRLHLLTEFIGFIFITRLVNEIPKWNRLSVQTRKWNRVSVYVRDGKQEFFKRYFKNSSPIDELGKWCQEMLVGGPAQVWGTGGRFPRRPCEREPALPAATNQHRHTEETSVEILT